MVPGESADVRLARPDVGEEELAEVAAVLETGQLTMGPKVAELEAELARACGTEHAVVVSSGTAALHLAVLALGIGPGDEVIVPAYTFPATANVVALVGARPVLVDVDPETFNLDPAKVELTPRTKAILPVHLFGRPARLEELPEATLLEDAAGALGAERRGASMRRPRSRGLPLVPSAQDRHDRRGRRGHDQRRPSSPSASARLATTAGAPPTATTTCRAARRTTASRTSSARSASRRLGRLEALLAARERIAAGYAERLAGLPVRLPGADEGDRHGWQAYVIQLDRRDEAMAALRAQGIQCQIGTYALHRLSAYRDQGEFPGADHCFERALALPLHTRLTDSELDRVAEALTAVVSE